VTTQQKISSGNAGNTKVGMEGEKESRARIFKLLRSPGIDSKESACLCSLAGRYGTLFLLGSYPHRLFKNSSTGFSRHPLWYLFIAFTARAVDYTLDQNICRNVRCVILFFSLLSDPKYMKCIATTRNFYSVLDHICKKSLNSLLCQTFSSETGYVLISCDISCLIFSAFQSFKPHFISWEGHSISIFV